MKSVREFVAEDRSRYRWIVEGGLAGLDCFVPLSKLATEHLHMRMSIRDMQRLLQEAADILQEIGSNALGRCEEQGCLAVAVGKYPNQESGRALCSKHSGGADVALQGYQWSNLWTLEDSLLINRTPVAHVHEHRLQPTTVAVEDVEDHCNALGDCDPKVATNSCNEQATTS